MQDKQSERRLIGAKAHSHYVNICIRVYSIVNQDMTVTQCEEDEDIAPIHLHGVQYSITRHPKLLQRLNVKLGSNGIAYQSLHCIMHLYSSFFFNLFRSLGNRQKNPLDPFNIRLKSAELHKATFVLATAPLKDIAIYVFVYVNMQKAWMVVWARTI